MKYLSICSGIEAASVAFGPLGWKPLAFSEIEAFPRAVLQHHYPDTPLHGDFTKLKDEPWIVDADMLCGGTPCQAFSVAGLRQSLADDRGNLTLQFVLLADAIDNLRRAAGREPAWILWENVPGVLSTKDNAFGAFLGGLCGRHEPIAEPADGWTRAGVVDGPARVAAWRVMDAQHFGLAQRRQRVFVLARGGAGRWAAADALLPIIESSGWHPAPSRSTGERPAPTISARTKGGGGLGTDFDLDEGLQAIAIQERAVSENPDAGPQGKGWQNDLGFTLESRHQSQFVAAPIVMATGQASAMSAPTIDMAPTLSCNHEAPILMRMREGKEGGGKGPLVSEDQSLTLATGNDQVLAFQDISDCLTSAYGTKWNGNASAENGSLYAKHGMQVRRLTPVECERLQGFPIVRQMLYIAACLDPASGSVDVALRCHRLQSSVWPADANELMQFAATAEEYSNTPQASQEPLVLARVLMHSEAKVQELRSAGKLIWSAKSADEQRECHQPTRVEAIAHALARHGHVVVKEIMDGKEVSPQNTSDSSHRKSGETCVTLSIAGTEASVSDATNDRSEEWLPFTTSELGQVIPKEDSTLATALCSVIHAIAGSIPKQTLPANFCIAVEVGRGYTNIPWRGKPESPDGPRYKALGNSWAVPCARWIGERIKAIRP